AAAPGPPVRETVPHSAWFRACLWSVVHGRARCTLPSGPSRSPETFGQPEGRCQRKDNEPQITVVHCFSRAYYSRSSERRPMILPSRTSTSTSGFVIVRCSGRVSFATRTVSRGEATLPSVVRRYVDTLDDFVTRSIVTISRVSRKK